MLEEDPKLESPEAERAILGTCLLDPGLARQVVVRLSESHFGEPPYRMVFAAISGLIDEGHEVDCQTIQGQLERTGKWRSVGSATLYTLDADLPDPRRWESYAAILDDRLARRQLSALGKRLIREAKDYEGDGRELFARAVDSLHALDSRLNGSSTPDLSQTLADIRANLGKAQKAGERPGLRFPWQDVDRMLKGARPQELFIVAGRPGMGKTSIALQMMLAWTNCGKRGAFRSLEMSRQDLAIRLLSQETGVPFSLIQDDEMDVEERNKVAEAAERMGKLPFLIEDVGATDRQGISAWARRIHSFGKLDYLMIDHLAEMTGEDDERVRYGEAASAFKRLSKDLNIPVILLHQLNRNVVSRGQAGRSDDEEKYWPQLTDLAGADKIAQAADAVCFVHRPGYYDATQPENEAVFIVRKRRNGPVGHARIPWNGQTMSFQ